MKVFITGATGFIGTHLLRRLVETKHEPICLVRRQSNIRELEKLGVELALGDIRDKGTLRAPMAGCDWVIHLAGISSFWEPDKQLYTQTNVQGTRNVMECALEASVSKVVHVSTMAVYGKPADSPFNEDSTIGPQRFSMYARTKYEGDLVAWGLHHKKMLPLVVCYPAVVLGAVGTNHLSGIIRRFIQHRMPAKAFMNSIHTYTHINDVTEALIRAAEKQDNIGQRYFIGDHRLQTRDFLRLVSSVSGAYIPRITLPDSVAMLCAHFFTVFAGLTGKPPVLGMAADYARTAREGMIAEGTRAQQELGITYTPIKDALAEEIDYLRMTEKLYDRRRSERHQVDLNVLYQAQGQDHEIKAHLSNISEGGMLIDTDLPSGKGKYVSANLFGDQPGRYFYVRGRVLRKTESGMAVEIIHSDKEINHILSEMK